MLTEETQQILCNLFITLAKGERNIQITRQVLSNSFDFSPYLIFFHLSNNNSKYITAIDIYNYLNSKYIEISENESKLILLFYDKNLDNVLSFEEFFYFIQNGKNLKNNSNFIVPKKTPLSPNIEFLLLKLFKKEIDLAKKVLKYLKKLKQRQDFDIHKIFHSIASLNYINKFCMGRFFEKNYNNYLESDIKNMIRRLDINKDGAIDLREFYSFLEFPKSANNYYRFIPCNICREKLCDKCLYIKNNNNNENLLYNSIDNKNISISQNFRKNYNLYSINCCSGRNYPKNEINENILMKSQPEVNLRKYNSLTNIFEENKKNNYNFNSPLIYTLRSKLSILKNRKKIEENPYYKIYPKNFLSPKMKSNYINILDKCFNSYKDRNNICTNNTFDIENFNNFLKLIMKKEIEIEKEKINFIKNTNYNFDEIFNFFDTNEKGYINITDLKNGFKNLGINNENENENEKDINIFMNRYDLKKLKKLHKLDFFDAIVPYEKQFRIVMENKNNINEKNSFYNKINKIYLKTLIMYIIDIEKEINEFKKKINIKDRIKKIFNLIDKDNKGYFTYNDLNQYLEKNNLILESFSIALIFIRFDKNREGKVNIFELNEEMKPFN